MAANLYRRVFDWVHNGIKVYVHSGHYQEEGLIEDQQVRTALWGTHSKSMIFESIDHNGNLVQEVMVGTYNVDNRSNYYNNELAVFCQGSESLTAELKENMNRRIHAGYRLTEGNRAVDPEGNEVSIYGMNEEKRLSMKRMTFLARLFQFLM